MLGKVELGRTCSSKERFFERFGFLKSWLDGDSKDLDFIAVHGTYQGFSPELLQTSEQLSFQDVGDRVK